LRNLKRMSNNSLESNHTMHSKYDSQASEFDNNNFINMSGSKSEVNNAVASSEKITSKGENEQ